MSSALMAPRKFLSGTLPAALSDSALIPIEGDPGEMRAKPSLFKNLAKPVSFFHVVSCPTPFSDSSSGLLFATHPVRFSSTFCGLNRSCHFLFWALGIFVCVFVPLVGATPLGGFSVLSANLNGFGNAYKLSLASLAVQTHRPSAFVMNETKSTNPCAHLLDVPEYVLYESVGVPSGPRTGKWGIVLGIRRGIQIMRQIEAPLHLQGRLVAIDIVVPLGNSRPFCLWLIGLYAPWDSGGLQAAGFWASVAEVASAQPSPNGSILVGDCNVTLRPCEHSTHVTPDATHYRNFLHSTGANDLWLLQGGFSLHRDYTLKSYNGGNLSTVDQAAVISPSPYSALIHALPDFLGNTDHRAILVHTSFDSFHQNGSGSHPPDPTLLITPPSLPPPRLQYPGHGKKDKYHLFADEVDAALALWNKREIQQLNRNIKAIGSLIFRLRSGPLLPLHFLPYCVWEMARMIPPNSSPQNATQFLHAQRKRFCKERYWLMNRLAYERAVSHENGRFNAVLCGQSAKSLIPHCVFADLPMVLEDPQTGELVSSPDEVKAATSFYFQ
ncbi:uncharacterized protein EI90DRAFT_3122473 [Cantharellus anzutake]|uniref:uncharacterized protein n=1 Tax=Cantharellus anzutake TaxID=1750568 RepID=UPI0019081363|nr:uncharacterized protein EI90DRAFT_3122473 [Cantharellus anzutake]KAF8332739.1 hypothetical protein EI90DRAFT_3122473 [Cantharellus anzutake]